MSMKQNMDTLNKQQNSLANETAALNTGFNEKINVLLSEIVNQESEIVILQNKLADLSGGVTQPQNTRTAETQFKNKIYVAKKGDTLHKLAEKFNVSMDKLKKANKLTSNSLHKGQKLIIP